MSNMITIPLPDFVMLPNSIAPNFSIKSLELKDIINLFHELTFKFDEIEFKIKATIDDINFSILSIPYINNRMDTIIIAEISDFDRFNSTDKISVCVKMQP